MNFSSRREYKIINKRRFFIFLTVLTISIIIIILCFKVYAKDTSNYTIETIYVGVGDTLWCISEKYAPYNIDIRLYLEKVIELNKLNSVIIIPGQLLLVPIYNN